MTQHYEYSECDEVAANMAPPAFDDRDHAFRWVREHLPTESMIVCDNVAVSLWDRQQEREW